MKALSPSRSRLVLHACLLLSLPLSAQSVREESVRFVVQGDTLAGTLSVPTTPGSHPAVVLLSGGNADNRDEQMGSFRPFKILADSLASIGMIVLRYDDRGVGESGGRQTWQYLKDDHIAEPLAAMAFLKSRPEVDSNRIGLLGHSYGTFMAASATQRGAGPRFLILLAPPGVPYRQIQAGFQRRVALHLGKTPAEAEDASKFELEFVGQAVQGKLEWKKLESMMRQRLQRDWLLLSDSVRAQTGSFENYFAESFYAFTLEFGPTPWMRSFWDFDPRPVYEHVEAPVLLVFGTSDLTCPPDECAAPLQEALAKGGNRDVVLWLIPDANHNLRNQKASPGQFAPGVVTGIVNWLRTRF